MPAIRNSISFQCKMWQLWILGTETVAAMSVSDPSRLPSLWRVLFPERPRLRKTGERELDSLCRSSVS